MPLNENDWPATVVLPGVVSEGTLNPEHLIPKFAWLVKEIDPWLYRESKDWCTPCLDAFQKGERHSFGLTELRDQFSVLGRLQDALEELAPEGYYFGTQEGDGACFGFFEAESDD